MNIREISFQELQQDEGDSVYDYRFTLSYTCVRMRKENRENFSTTTSFIFPYAFVKHDYKTKQQESRPYIV